MRHKTAIPTAIFVLLAAMAAVNTVSAGLAQAANPSQPAIAKRIGTIKAINGNALTLAPESGPEVPVTVEPNARLLRMTPGDKDLKNAASIQLQDLQVGDTVRVRGRASDDGKSIDALEVLVITRSAIDAVREQIQQDWQKRGLGGLVSSVDPAAGTVTVSVTGFGGKKSVVVHAAKNTIIRRYASDSVKFDDAKPGSLQEIHPGDQLRARGEKSADGLEMTAEEIVTGSFRNIAGTVISVDASAGTLNVQDLLTKKPIVVKITSDSQLHQLPAEFAQRIAMRLKSSMAGGAASGSAGNHAEAAPGAGGPGRGGVPAGGANGGQMSGMHQGGAPDFQQMLNRMPPVTLSDLHKGDAVLIVATEGSASSSTAITLLSGVEPILQAAPSGSQAMMLTPWSLGGAPGGDAMQ
ncbi:MAG TPA: DUF5666 domain-containing protein [Candidatus Acidoferrales bacterium]|nr:DUF5666 domain-containing protein [Candidatus Acidoferrales bacterium]